MASRALQVAGLALGSWLPAQGFVLDRLPPDAPAARFREVAFGAGFTPVMLPGEGRITGLARQRDVLWVRREANLLAVAWPAGTVLRTLPAPENTTGLAADERFLYLLQGRSVVVFDADAGLVMRTVALPLTWAPTAFAARAGELLVTDGGTLRLVDLRTGTVKATLGESCNLLQWFAHDGQRWLAGDGVDVLDVATRTALRRWPALVEHGCATVVDGRLLCAVTLPPTAGDTTSFVGYVALDAARPRLLRVEDTGPRLRYEFDGQCHGSLDALQRALHALAGDERARVRGPDGRSRPVPIELVAAGPVTVAELKTVWQAVVTAGLPDVRCPAQEAWWQRHGKAADAAGGKGGR